MYIEPNTTIKIYGGIPLDNSYTNTLYFLSRLDQTTFFSTTRYLKYTLANNTYQRVERGRMRIEKKADELYGCNYLAFQNTNYGNKWFYAFITGVEFINNVTSEITFEIDTIQTYMFDIELKNCFVEREHTRYDEIGGNIQKEPVATGEYIISDRTKMSYLSDMAVLIMETLKIEGTQHDAGTLYEGIYGGAKIYAFNSTDDTHISEHLDSFIQAPDNVYAVYMCPSFLINGTTPIPDGGMDLGRTTVSSILTQQFPAPLDNNISHDFGGYTPKNKKLYTYPYNYARLDNNSGQSLNLRYEFFVNNIPEIEVSGTFLMPVKLVGRPVAYKGLQRGSGLQASEVSTSECITLDNYPMCTWNVDAFQNWLAQNTVPIVLNATGSAVNSALALGMSSMASETGTPSSSIVGGTAMQGISGITNLLKQTYLASIAADDCRGNLSNGNVNVSNNRQAFYMSRCHLTANYAKVIDNFFTMYGYACNEVKTPSLMNRPHWSYTKTNGCCAVPKEETGAPADEIKRFCSIFDKGITFWMYASEVGDYTLDNSPT